MHAQSMMHTLASILVVVLLAVATGGSATAQAPDDLASLNAQFAKLYGEGKYLEATEIANQFLALAERKFGPDHPYVGTALGNLAMLSRAQGRYPEAEPLMKRSLALYEKALGPDHPWVATSLNNLAELYQKQGRYAEAEPLMKRSLALYEKAQGPDHPAVATPLHNLAELYLAQGRYAAAEPLMKRSLVLYERALGPDHPAVATSLNNLALLYQKQGRYTEVEPLMKRSLAIREKTLGLDHPDVGTALGNLAALYRAQGRYPEAEPLYKRTVTILERALGPDHPWVATSLNNLASLYQSQGRYAEAEPLMKRDLAISEKSLGPDHPEVGTSLDNIALLYFTQRNWGRAADFWRRSTALSVRRGHRGTASGSVQSSAQKKSEMDQLGHRVFGLVKAVRRLETEQRITTPTLTGETFTTAQWAQSSQAAASLTQMAARGAAGNPQLATIVRERQDLIEEWQWRDGARTTAVSQPTALRQPQGEAANVSRLTEIDSRIAAIDKQLAAEFPDYAALASPAPLTVEQVQADLRSSEALVLFLDTPEWRPTPEETFVWVVTKTEVRWVRSDLGTPALRREVEALRCGLDAAAWHGDGDNRCADLLKLTPDSLPKPDTPLPFDAARAHKLYVALFGEVEDLIKGKHLLLVPSGPLTTLPFQVLVTKPPASNDLAAVEWLIRDHAIAVLPSVASLTALRRTGKPSAATKPMIGFGNPLLDGDQQHPQYGTYIKEQAAIARGQTGCAATPTKRTATLRAISRRPSPVPQAAGLADLAHLRVQTPLPETADELCEVARSLGADVSEIRIGARATEREIKQLSASGELARYRVVHFATHGLLAGELKGTNEPGLILSPPAQATADDDGYLSGGEIASLKLEADWVILSACNTAGGAGAGEAAEALSGLARVFFYAGARALFVSHWEVDSAATVQLITSAMRELAKDKWLGRADALRRAMLAVMADATRPANWVPASHPSVWAPFVVVGEGGEVIVCYFRGEQTSARRADRQLRVTRIARQSSHRRCRRETDEESIAKAMHRAADTIPQQADVVGVGLPVADPGSVEDRFCIGTSVHRTYARPDFG
jgi:CHAT domain-containing protein/tetratricopeptide (TPR) repeat protein